jgi:hypothetical protein
VLSVCSLVKLFSSPCPSVYSVVKPLLFLCALCVLCG